MPRASSGSKGDFKPCPEGVTQGVLVDVVDLGLVKSTFNGEEKTQRKAMLVWQVDERRDDGQRFHIYQRVGLSLHPKANLRKLVDTIRAKKMTEEEAEAGIELEDLIGSQGLLTLVQNPSGDRIYTNVEGVAPLMKSMSKLDVEDYTRPDFLQEAADKAAAAQGEDAPF